MAGATTVSTKRSDGFVELEGWDFPEVTIGEAGKAAKQEGVVAFAVREKGGEGEGGGEGVWELDSNALGGLLAEEKEAAEFTGKAGSSLFVRVPPNSDTFKAKYAGLIGVGDGGAESLQAAAVTLAKEASKKRVASASLAVLDGDAISTDALTVITKGVALGSYTDKRFKSKKEEEKPPKRLETFSILADKAGGDADTAKSISDGIGLAAGALVAKQLVGAPANVCNPTALANAALAIASNHPDVMTCTILEKEECEKLGMGLYLGVAEAAETPPRFIHLTYKPVGATGDEPKVGVVGKGLTFDSGGYNIKAGAGSMIEMMKFDMGGSAATLGAAEAVANIKPSGVEAHFIVAACENMVAGGGMRPGDILRASNGKTVEVNNTDAEGRLTLADALVYAHRNAKVEACVDIATLTGACMVALGMKIGGIYSPQDEMAESLIAAGKAQNEKLWRMPLEKSYFEGLKSSLADMKNTGPRPGGSITAALFLNEYIGEGMKWAHIDMAGPVWDGKSDTATGFGAATLASWICNYKK